MSQQKNQPFPGRNIQVRIMPGIERPELEFLRFQVGEWIEFHLSLPEIPGVRREVESPARRFHLLGFGRSRDAALAMAQMPSSIPSNLNQD